MGFELRATDRKQTLHGTCWPNENTEKLQPWWKEAGTSSSVGNYFIWKCSETRAELWKEMFFLLLFSPALERRVSKNLTQLQRREYWQREDATGGKWDTCFAIWAKCPFNAQPDDLKKLQKEIEGVKKRPSLNPREDIRFLEMEKTHNQQSIMFWV